MSRDYRNILDSADWSGIHWSLLASTGLGFFAWGFVYSLSTLLTSWPVVPPERVPILLTLTPVFLVIGNVLFGFVSDRLGRKPVFAVTLAMYTIGIAGIILSPDFYTLIFFVALAQMGAGGEEPPALAALAELMPVRHRGRAIIISSNFYNVGAFVAALLVLYGLSSLQLQKSVLGSAALVLIAAIIIVRSRLPESVRWLSKKGRKDEAERIVHSIRGRGQKREEQAKTGVYSPRGSFVFLAILGISQLATYGLLAFVVGPYYYSSLVPQIILVANAGASLAGILAGYLVESMRRKKYSLLSYFGGLATVLLLLLAVDLVSSNIVIFLSFLFLNMIFSELAWGARVVLEPELAKGTGVRSTFVALVRVVAWSFYIASIYYTSSLGVTDFAKFNVVLWGLGAMAALWWFTKGIETRTSLEMITGEE